MQDSLSRLRVVPLTSDRWPAFEDLFGKSGPSSRCWPMYWRIGASYRKQSPDANKLAFQEVVRRGIAESWSDQVAPTGYGATFHLVGSQSRKACTPYRAMKSRNRIHAAGFRHAATATLD